jgi:predicted nucleic acid-binding protein
VAKNQRDYLIIDACVLINLIATGLLKEILRLIAQNSVICVLVKGESLYLRNEDDINELESIDIDNLVNQEIIQISDCETDDEQLLFVNLAANLDDGEAMSVAIALSRNWHLATDDKKARRIFTENSQDKQLLVSTTDLIKEWVENEDIDDLTLKSILLKVERKASFRPSKSDINLQWWNDILSAE